MIEAHDAVARCAIVETRRFEPRLDGIGHVPDRELVAEAVLEVAGEVRRARLGVATEHGARAREVDIAVLRAGRNTQASRDSDRSENGEAQHVGLLRGAPIVARADAIGYRHPISALKKSSGALHAFEDA